MLVQLIFNTPEDLHHKDYYQAFDVVVAELNRRFNMPSFSVMKEIENILLQSFNGVHVPFSDEFCKLYNDELNFEQLSYN